MSVEPTQRWAPPTPDNDPLDVTELNNEEEFPSSTRARIWHIRINGLSPEDIEDLKSRLLPHARSLVIGVREHGKVHSQGHHHIHFHGLEQMRKSTLVGLLGALLIDMEGWYIAPARDPSKNRAYCSKNGVLFEFDKPSVVPAMKRAHESEDEEGGDGEWENRQWSSALLNMEFPTPYSMVALIQVLPKQERHDYARFLTGHHKKAAPMNVYETVHCRFGHIAGLALLPEVYYGTVGTNIRKLNVNPLSVEFPSSEEQEIFWIHGKAGTGKTSFTSMLYPNHYVKNKGTQYWESYNFLDHSKENQHMCVVFNEVDIVSDLTAFSENGKSFDTIKMVLDIKPFPIEIKHKNQELIRPRRIYITSNTTLDCLMTSAQMLARHDTPTNTLFGLDTEVLRAALKRRVKEVSIEDLLEQYGLYCFAPMTGLPFGGVFPKHLRVDINKELRNACRTFYTDHLGRYEEVARIRRKYEAETVEFLKPMRWVNYELISMLRNVNTAQVDSLIEGLGALVEEDVRFNTEIHPLARN